MNINENLKNEVKQFKLLLIHFDQPFRPVILYENYLIRIVMNINKTSKMRIGLVVSEKVGVRSSLGAPCCVLGRHIYSDKSTDNTQVAMAPSRHD